MGEKGWGRKKFEKKIKELDRGSGSVERGEGRHVATWVAVHGGR